jgi:hypothetical protein
MQTNSHFLSCNNSACIDKTPNEPLGENTAKHRQSISQPMYQSMWILIISVKVPPLYEDC